MSPRIGDIVKPAPEWEGTGCVPSGRILRIVPFGKSGAVYVEGDHRAYVTDVFEVVPALDREKAGHGTPLFAERVSA